MRLGRWRREAAVAGGDGEGLKMRNEGRLHSLRAALLGGILGGGSGTTSSPASTTAAPSANSGGLLSPVLGGIAGELSPVGAPLGLGIGPSSAPLLSVALAPSSGPLIGAGVGPTSAPLLSLGVDPTGTLLGVGAGPTSAPLVSVGFDPLASPSQPLLGVGSGPISSPLLSIGVDSLAATASVSGLLSVGVSGKSILTTSSALSTISLQPSESTPLAQARPSTAIPTTLTTITAAPDTAPSSSGVEQSGTSSTGSNSGTTGGVDNSGGTGANGIAKTSAGHSNTTIVIGITTAVGALAIFVGFVVFIRRYFRNRRLGKAEFPPSSPLLPPMEDSFLPSSIERNISRRSGVSSYRSDGFGSNEGNTVLRGKIDPQKQGGFGQGYRNIADLSPLPPPSPLPPVAKGGGERDIFVDGVHFSLASKEGIVWRREG